MKRTKKETIESQVNIWRHYPKTNEELFFISEAEADRVGKDNNFFMSSPACDFAIERAEDHCSEDECLKEMCQYCPIKEIFGTNYSNVPCLSEDSTYKKWEDCVESEDHEGAFKYAQELYDEISDFYKNQYGR